MSLFMLPVLVTLSRLPLLCFVIPEQNNFHLFPDVSDTVTVIPTRKQLWGPGVFSPEKRKHLCEFSAFYGFWGVIFL